MQTHKIRSLEAQYCENLLIFMFFLVNDSYDKNQLNAMRINREKVVMEVEKKKGFYRFFFENPKFCDKKRLNMTQN